MILNNLTRLKQFYQEKQIVFLSISGVSIVLFMLYKIYNSNTFSIFFYPAILLLTLGIEHLILKANFKKLRFKLILSLMVIFFGGACLFGFLNQRRLYLSQPLFFLFYLHILDLLALSIISARSKIIFTVISITIFFISTPILISNFSGILDFYTFFSWYIISAILDFCLSIFVAAIIVAIFLFLSELYNLKTVNDAIILYNRNKPQKIIRVTQKTYRIVKFAQIVLFITLGSLAGLLGLITAWAYFTGNLQSFQEYSTNLSLRLIEIIRDPILDIFVMIISVDGFIISIAMVELILSIFRRMSINYTSIFNRSCPNCYKMVYFKQLPSKLCQCPECQKYFHSNRNQTPYHIVEKGIILFVFEKLLKKAIDVFWLILVVILKSFNQKIKKFLS